MSVLDRLTEIELEAARVLKEAQSKEAFEECRILFLGKKGKVSEVLAQLKDLSADERKTVGQRANELRDFISKEIDSKRKTFEQAALQEKLFADRLDVSLPGVRQLRGERHPISKTLQDLREILRRLGLVCAYGPEVEWEEYCFDRLNFKPGHAARDMQATFFVKTDQPRAVILRTHTSPVQVRTLLAAAKAGRPLPIRIQAPGRVYRVDDDATHAPMFHQIEGLVVDTSSTLGDLNAHLQFLFREFFEDPKIKTRFRPSYFPFTEPSAEVDISCVFCKGSGCRVCKQSGWLEVGGAGMVHPEVFRLCDWDPEKVQGWAFGIGVERLGMLKFGVPDLRLYFENRLGFLRGTA